MTDLERQGLKGPVQKLLTEWDTGDGPRVLEVVFNRAGNMVSLSQRGPDGSEQRQEYRYDANGELVDPRSRVIRGANGSATVIQDVSGLNSWTRDGLHSVGFGTWGASVARTTVDDRRVAVGTVFEDSQNQEVSVIRYVYNENGDIVEAVQYGGSGARFPGGVPVTFGDGPVAVPEFHPGGELSRVVFRYDGARRVVEQTIYFIGQPFLSKVNTYNDEGDLLTSKAEFGMLYTGDKKPQTFEYEYDSHRNWVRKIVHHTSGTDEYRRSIAYFPA